MNYLFGTGWWIIWYALLWLAVVPFAVMTAALTRATQNDPMMLMENTFGFCTLGLVILMGGTAISGYLWTAGTPAAAVWPYVRNIVGAVLAAVVVGLFLVFGAQYYAVTPKQPMLNRWAAQIICLASAILMLVFCLQATWRFRRR